MHSQNISIKKTRVQTVVTKEGDTLVQFKIKDARVILADLLDKEIVDSLLVIYEEKDKLNEELIGIRVEEIRLLQQKSLNHELQITNLNKVISNKDAELLIKEDELIKAKKEIRKQKTLKVLSFIGMVVLTTLTILIAN